MQFKFLCFFLHPAGMTSCIETRSARYDPPPQWQFSFYSTMDYWSLIVSSLITLELCSELLALCRFGHYIVGNQAYFNLHLECFRWNEYFCTVHAPFFSLTTRKTFTFSTMAYCLVSCYYQWSESCRYKCSVSCVVLWTFVYCGHPNYWLRAH